MEKIKVHTITRKEAKELLQRLECQLDQFLTEKFRTEAYLLPDGTVLQKSPTGKWAIWPSRDVLVHIIEDAEANPRQHLLAAVFPNGESFPSEVPRLITELAVKLNLPVEQLDFTDKSIKRLERAVLRQIRRWSSLDSDLFPLLTAYVGESIRRRRGGEWLMRLGWDGKTWEPWIRFPNGQEYSPTDPLLKARENGVRGTLYWCLWDYFRDAPDLHQKR